LFGIGSMILLWAALIALSGGQPSSCVAEAAGPGQDRRSAVAILNLDRDEVFSEAYVDSVLSAEADRPVSWRIGAWARRFLAAPGVSYLFGPAEGGYVAQGRLVLDTRHDCVSLMYRCSELGRSSAAIEALDLALDTRFAGAPIDSVIDAAGRVDYDRPEHLDFSLDMIRSGHWGEDITADLDEAMLDNTGSSRYEAGSFQYLPTGRVAEADLREGDIAWLVLDPASESGRKLRKKYGLVIGHLGVVIVEHGEPWLIHAASSGLDGYYDGGTIVQVPLAVYLARVEKFSGVVITRMP
jgi:hypothetical protein